MPISQCIDSHTDLFYNSHHQTKGRVSYVILVLIQRYNPDYEYCQHSMVKLNMTENELIHLDLQQKKFMYCHPSDFNMWMELFVVGDVSLTDGNHTWDIVNVNSQIKSAQRRKSIRGMKYRDTYDQYDDEDDIDYHEDDNGH